MLEKRSYKCDLDMNIPLTSLLDEMDEYFTFGGEQQSLGERMLNKLKNQ